jgi:hypothetical protein
MDILRDWWAMFLGVIGGVFWLSRLEWRSLNNEKEIRRMWEQRQIDLDSAAEARRENNEVLKEIREDIKRLLILTGGDK